MTKYNYIKWFNEIDKNDIPVVGGKGANLGEMTQRELMYHLDFVLQQVHTRILSN